MLVRNQEVAVGNQEGMVGTQEGIKNNVVAGGR